MKMRDTNKISRRRFAGGMAAIIGGLRLSAGGQVFGQAVGANAAVAAGRVSVKDYEALTKLCYNENPYGPTKSVQDAMTGALEFANRYMSPDGGILDAIASLHKVDIDHIVLGSGSSEILDAVGTAFLEGGKKVVGAEPTFDAVYRHATGLKTDAIHVPLTAGWRQDIPAMIDAVKQHRGQIGFVYICNPNNPTGVIVTKSEIKQLLDGLPADVPVLIDEAYHHFVEDPAYETSISHATEGRPVIVARTFSKIAALAGIRLGYAVAPPALIEKMSPYIEHMNVNILAKWGGAAALKDPAGLERVRNDINHTRKNTTAALVGMGYTVIPSETNFFMVNLRRDVRPVIKEFRRNGILVGRPFPPMVEYLRVSVGTPAEMERFLTSFQVIMKA